MKLLKTWWNRFLWLIVFTVLLTACGQTTPASLHSGAVYREATVALPTSAPTPKNTPLNTRVLPLDSLTPAPTPTITPIPDEIEAMVTNVIDGRTITVVMQGDPLSQAYPVRYLGIDPPPLDTPWGDIAFETNRKMTYLKVVRLVRDTSDFDDEGYLLRYVYVDDELLSIILTEQGLARADLRPPNIRFEAEILEAQARAKNGKLGLWGGTPTPTLSPSPVQEGTTEPTAANPSPTMAATSEPATPQTPSPEAEPDEVSATDTPSPQAATPVTPDNTSTDN
ncbi:MAG: thermonuclease family protein [Anaerolineae bacterium]|nr:thermonuclease family protein [Anaerolineae bacterium]